ncbi:CpsD/CapB family tyrosine-protein kinase [Roseovarius sp. E0-M6]|uniref:CpsD/CapB family tyrosine-protein kinase n=1 Tax=Roseovarius sp. E0-M6 TaxID=3127118 RepID=UPI00301014A0
MTDSETRAYLDKLRADATPVSDESDDEVQQDETVPMPRFDPDLLARDAETDVDPPASKAPETGGFAEDSANFEYAEDAPADPVPETDEDQGDVVRTSMTDMIAHEDISVMPMPSPPAMRLSGSAWNELPSIPIQGRANDALRVQRFVAGEDDRVIRVIDDLRTQLLRSLESETWKRIAITAPSVGCGATFTALNLALSMSRIPEFRTVLMDMNQRDPAIARALNLRGRSDIGKFLTGEVPAREHLLRFSDTLALGLNTERPLNPSERLHSRRAHIALDNMIADLDPDIVLYDLPPMLDYDDVSAFLPQVDGVLLVADAKRTLGSQIEECERRLAGKTPLLGVILNRGRNDADHARAA